MRAFFPILLVWQAVASAIVVAASIRSAQISRRLEQADQDQ